MVFLYIYAEDKIFRAKSHIGVSEEERSDINWGLLKINICGMFSLNSLQCSGFQMFGCNRLLDRQMYHLPGGEL